jgi:hypothetical protein
MTETQQEAILRKVRGLIAKANSTEHEGERQVFMAKADELMEKYAIDQALLLLKQDPNARLVVRKDMDISWWSQMHGIDPDARNEIAYLWSSCVTHCRCVTSFSTWNFSTKTAAVFGTEGDLAYLDLLFTDLFIQMTEKLRPTFNPNAEIGSQVRLAKEAGMTWDQILDWAGLRGTPEGKRLLPAYRRYCEAHGLQQVKINPKTYQWSFVEAFCGTIRSRLYAMRQRDDGGPSAGNELVLRDIRDQAREEMYNVFPDLRPHPSNCQCSNCVAARKRRLPALRQRVVSGAARQHGSAAGADARIVSNAQSVAKSKKEQLGK